MRHVTAFALACALSIGVLAPGVSLAQQQGQPFPQQQQQQPFPQQQQQPQQRQQFQQQQQQQPRQQFQQQQQQAPEAQQLEVPSERISNEVAVFAGLDKITARVTSFEVAIDETVEFGALKVTPRVCYSRPPTEPPKTTAFVEIDEEEIDGSVSRIFTGWMFASNPGLHAVEHPVFDVWLTDCKSDSTSEPEAPSDRE